MPRRKPLTIRQLRKEAKVLPEANKSPYGCQAKNELLVSKWVSVQQIIFRLLSWTGPDRRGAPSPSDLLPARGRQRDDETLVVPPRGRSQPACPDKSR